MIYAGEKSREQVVQTTNNCNRWRKCHVQTNITECGKIIHLKRILNEIHYIVSFGYMETNPGDIESYEKRIVNRSFKVAFWTRRFLRNSPKRVVQSEWKEAPKNYSLHLLKDSFKTGQQRTNNERLLVSSLKPSVWRTAHEWVVWAIIFRLVSNSFCFVWAGQKLVVWMTHSYDHGFRSKKPIIYSASSNIWKI